eukprot:CAMPEP_0173235174 /NCGR_PEP_ID=MMETSP1142-20121109/10683_1 /TAXON_ID=483371 /ORGANISM="non described non described, Strain CCMP2298" /LENGTH=192 /DNA_ID=CAMNT_0014165393 /DNA_START=757 /DNA_END=1334 /DNA_ORIENTATION=+
MSAGVTNLHPLQGVGFGSSPYGHPPLFLLPPSPPSQAPPGRAFVWMLPECPSCPALGAPAANTAHAGSAGNDVDAEDGRDAADGGDVKSMRGRAAGASSSGAAPAPDSPSPLCCVPAAAPARATSAAAASRLGSFYEDVPQHSGVLACAVALLHELFDRVGCGDRGVAGCIGESASHAVGGPVVQASLARSL